MYSKASTFSRVYVEEAVRDLPRTRRILGRLPRATVVPVDDYQNVFGRGRQDFWRQKAAPALVLARKKEHFLYAGNAFQQSGMSSNFAYTAPVLNCPYDCHYCYLQGLYAGAHVVAFVNLEEAFAAAAAALQARPDPARPLDLALSYDTDLLALEGLLGFTAEWVEWSRGRPDLLLEVRTKSAPLRFIGMVAPSEAVRLVWTLSPEAVCRDYESGAPSLQHRLKALTRAASLGWRIGICLDPVLRVPDWRAHYGGLADRLREALPRGAVERVEIGVFRVSTGHFKRMRRRPGRDLLHYPYEHANNAVSYLKSEREELVETIRSLLRGTISNDLIHIWT